MATMADVAEALLPGGIKGCTADDCKDLGNKMLQVCLKSSASHAFNANPNPMRRPNTPVTS